MSIENELLVVAADEAAEAYFPPPLLIWREFFQDFTWAFRVVIYTSYVVERERFFNFSSLSEALDLGDMRFDDPIWKSAFDAFKECAREVELRPLAELEK